MIDSVYAGGGAVVGPDAYDSVVTALGSSTQAMYGQAAEPERIQNTLEPDRGGRTTARSTGKSTAQDTSRGQNRPF